MKNFFLFSFVIFCLTIGAFSCQSSRDQETKGDQNMEMNWDNSSYAALWQAVEKQEQEGKVQSALNALEPIFKKAGEEKNIPQKIKALFHKFKYQMTLSEEAEVKTLKELELEIASAVFPAKPLLQSILAELYWQYYEMNRYKFMQRTATAGEVSEDPSMWDLSTLFKKIAELYRSSLVDAAQLKEISSEAFKDILEEGNALPERPTLYDFLAHRALDYFMNEEVSLPQPAYSFQLEDSRLFGEAAEFVKLDIQTEDTESLKYQAFRILQDLTRLHLEDKQTTALIEVELKRLKFVKAHAAGLDKAGLYITALTNLKQKYGNTPLFARITFALALDYYEGGTNYIDTLTRNQAQQSLLRQAYALCDEVLARFPDSTIPESMLGTMPDAGTGRLTENVKKDIHNAAALKANILTKGLTLTVENVNLPDEAFKALVNYRNLKQVYVRICLLDEKQQAELLNLYYNNEDLSLDDYYRRLTPVQSLQFNLPDKGDYLSHAAEIRLPPLKKGYYVLLASPREDFAKENNALAYALFWSSRIGYVQRLIRESNVENKNEFYVSDRLTGVPLANVKATLYKQEWVSLQRRYEYKKGESYTSNTNGYFRVAKAQANNFQIEFTLGDDRLFLGQQFYQSKDYDTNSQGVSTVNTFFFTDRAIYRPGQTVHFKGITIESGRGTDGKVFQARIRPKYKTKVGFWDVNHQKISDLDLVSNEYGTFSGSFVAPTGRLNGQMQISNESGQVSFSVEEYKRPKFEVVFTPVTGSYRLGETVKVSGDAKAYAGSVLDGADVKFRVVRRAVFPNWFWWWGFPPASPEVELRHGMVKTDTQGHFSIEFKALPDLNIAKKDRPVFHFDIYADVTDITGETHSNQSSLVIGYTALVLDIDVPGNINQDSNQSLKLTSTNLNGQFEPAKGQLAIYRLKDPGRSFRSRLWEKPDQFIYTKEEFYRFFPQDVYDNEDVPANWERSRKVVDMPFDTQVNPVAGLSELSQWEQGSYVLELTAKDKYNEPVTVSKYFTLFSLKNNAMPVKAKHWVVPLKVSGQPGEKAQLLIGSSEPDVQGFYEVIQDQKVLEVKPIQLRNEKKLLELPIKEEYRGNFSINLNLGGYNRYYTVSQLINVDWSHKKLNIEFETFRDKLQPGEQEEWRIRLSGQESEKLAAEMVATLYDASLEVFRPHNWYFSLYPSFGVSLPWDSEQAFSAIQSNLIDHDWNDYAYFSERIYDRLNYFGFSLYNSYSRPKMAFRGNFDPGAGEFEESMADDLNEQKSFEPLAPSPSTTEVDGIKKESDSKNTKTEPVKKAPSGSQDFGDVKARTNLQETAFFFPHLKTDAEGRTIISFTIPEALTRWRLLAFAHTKELSYGQWEKELVTQKSLMVMPHAPRFLREGDKFVLTAKVSNLTGSELAGEARLQLFDALTMQPLDTEFKNKQALLNFNVKQGQSAPLAWELSIPETVQAVTYRVLAKAGNFSDGEEAVLPVLTNRQLVTESLTINLREAGTKTFRFEKLLRSQESTTLRHHCLTLEFTANPAWYAVQALPYIMEYPYECSEQVFSRFYANSLATHITQSQPKLKRVFEAWKNVKNSQALLSNLEKNEELKSMLLEETPWVLQAQDESERKKRLGLLFDLNHMSMALSQAFNKLKEAQADNGGWPWFPGLPEDRYITQHIVSGLGHLSKLGVTSAAFVPDGEALKTMLRKAIGYIDQSMYESYTWLSKRKIRLDQNNLSYPVIHYLYARSFYKETPVDKNHQEAFDYWLKQAKTYWLDNPLYLKGQIALALNRFGAVDKAQAIMAALKETALYSEELGRYWKELDAGGYYWYQAPVETQALLIEAFYEVTADKKMVDDLRLWLLKQKQTRDWRTTKATADACYALLLLGTDWLSTDTALAISVGKEQLDLSRQAEASPEAGTGYFKSTWGPGAIKPDMGEVTVKKGQPGPAWGALYWQYFEQLDKLTAHETPLKLARQVFLQKETDRGAVLEPLAANVRLKPGDLLKIRIELRVDRDMEYIHMKDLRAAGFEPLNVISRHKYQDGLWYYESTKDTATHFFIPWLAKGNYVFEYPLRVSHSGDFSNGFTSIQCMYAPEFSAHSEGSRIKVE